MALEKPIEKLKENKKDKSTEKVFSKKNAKANYYTNMAKITNAQKPKPKHKKENTVENNIENNSEIVSENKPERKGGKIGNAVTGVYQSLINTGYLANLTEYDEDFDQNLFDQVGKNKPGDDPNKNLNRVIGDKNGGSSKIDIKSLEKPLKSIDETSKTFAASFKIIETELKEHTKLLTDIKTNFAKIKDSSNEDGGKKIDNMLSILKNVYKNKKEKYTPYLKKTIDKTKTISKDKIAKFAENANKFKGVTAEKLGGIGSQIRATTGTAISMAKTAASSSLSGGSVLGNAVMAGGRSLIASAALPVLGVSAAGAAGYGVGSLVHNAIEGTSVDNAIGSGVAHARAFFGDKEAQQAVEDTEKYKNFGALSGQMESNNNVGGISSGKGDAGGKSYGTFQLSSKQGSVDKFLASSGYKDKFQGLAVGSKEFDAKWKELSKNDENFGKAQNTYATKEYYAPTELGLKKEGIDLSSRGRAVKEVMMSTGVQYGASSKGSVDLIKKALAGRDVSKMSDKDVIDAIQDYKAKTVDTKFKSSSDAVKKGVAARIEKERAIAHALADKEDKDKGTKTEPSESDKSSNVKVTEIPVDSYKKRNSDKKGKTKIESIETKELSDNATNVNVSDKTYDIRKGDVMPPNYGQMYELEAQNNMSPFDKNSANMKRLEYLHKKNDEYNATNNKEPVQTNVQQSTPPTTPSSVPPKPANTQDGGGEKGSNLEVRKTPSTIQRILDRDFHLSV